MGGQDVELARFCLALLSVKGRMFSDSSMHTSVLLVDCTLDDTRPGRGAKITRYLKLGFLIWKLIVLIISRIFQDFLTSSLSHSCSNHICKIIYFAILHLEIKLKYSEIVFFSRKNIYTII